ncbi:hypothetical protein BB559_004143 [Furculomyces boomerangus]|uniref:Uncharacterized protein n=1 Tax=Furculomyces boomerangus TaxID=61424 RepID=A0A2T9YGN2_9FUNG|nr:hypothetical protein BB559_004143 [Furculomyces boomerangus]
MDFKAQKLPGNFTQINPSLLMDCPTDDATRNLGITVCNVNNINSTELKAIQSLYGRGSDCLFVSDHNTIYNVTIGNVPFSNSEIQKCSDAKSYKWKSSILLLGLLVFLI